jgi:YYY domain-containing protein
MTDIPMPLLTFVLWLLLVWLAGWLALPLARRVWSEAQCDLPDAGLAAGRVLLLWMWTLAAFWFGNAGVPARWGALLVYPLGALCAGLAWREWLSVRETVRSHRRGITASEAIFFAAFAFFFVLRGYWPDTLGVTGPDGPNGEKGMDMALIAACARADHLPPPNPYAGGARLSSYYYLGHFQTALLTNAIGATPRWTYNLMAATLPALCFSVLAMLCGALTGRVRNSAAAATLVLALGTLEPLRQWFFPPEGVERRTWPIDYFSTSRVIPFTINEYPWFTFNFADLHAHYFAMPLVLLIFSLGWSLYGHMNSGWQAREGKIVGVFCGLALGALIVTNTWDFPTYTLFISLCLLWTPVAPRHVEKRDDRRGAKGRARRKAGMVSRSRVMESDDRVLARPIALLIWVVASVVVVGIALLSAAPFLLRLHTAANRPQLLAQPASSSLPWLLLWGPMVGAWILTLAIETKRRRVAEAAQPPGKYPVLFLVRQRFALTAVIVLLVTWAWLWLISARDYFVIILLIFLTAWTAREAFRAAALTEDRRHDATYGFLCRLALCGLLALCWSEVTWAGFLAPPFHRQDTVFKFGLQAWFLLGTAAACGALRLVSVSINEEKTQSGAAWRRWPLVTRLAFPCALTVGMAAALSTTVTRARGFHKFEGWDAWAHLAPPERAAAAWLQQRARDGVHLIEAEQRQGGDYTEFSRYAHATGIPTVVGPQAHTFQWGIEWTDVFARKADVRAFYAGFREPDTRPPNGLMAGADRSAILRKYTVRYVVVGELERREYGGGDLAGLERALKPVFRAGDAADPHRMAIYEQP